MSSRYVVRSSRTGERRTVAARRGGTRTFARRRSHVCEPRGRADPDARARARARRPTRYVPIAAHRVASRATLGRWPLSWRPETADGSREVSEAIRAAGVARADLRDVGETARSDGPGLVREQRGARRSRRRPDRPTWRERASEYILAGGGDGGAGGRRRGPHERDYPRRTRRSRRQTDTSTRVRTTCSRRMPAPLDPTEVFGAFRDEVKGDETEPRARLGGVQNLGVDGFDPGSTELTGSTEWRRTRASDVRAWDDRRGDAFDGFDVSDGDVAVRRVSTRRRLGEGIRRTRVAPRD